MFLWNITYTELNKLAVIFYIILDIVRILYNQVLFPESKIPVIDLFLFVDCHVGRIIARIIIPASEKPSSPRR